MKITKTRLRQLIKEELSLLTEGSKNDPKVKEAFEDIIAKFIRHAGRTSRAEVEGWGKTSELYTFLEKSVEEEPALGEFGNLGWNFGPDGSPYPDDRWSKEGIKAIEKRALTFAGKVTDRYSTDPRPTMESFGVMSAPMGYPVFKDEFLYDPEHEGEWVGVNPDYKGPRSFRVEDQPGAAFGEDEEAIKRSFK